MNRLLGWCGFRYRKNLWPFPHFLLRRTSKAIEIKTYTWSTYYPCCLWTPRVL